MAQFLVSYGIESSSYNPHQKVLEQASNFGWFKLIKDYKEQYNILPNTTFIGWFDDLPSTLQSFLDLIERSRTECHGLLVLESYVVSEMGAHIFCKLK
ncbi:hypothetical protein [Methylobacterium sp. Leaf100]|uniref:hypothetical protein n=1 Tax=Methylobacterium sp. Leaf100 TaxID=1736252 RepID=UPI000B25308C|nr:hypothetical protein [Methylobacterium sp. Leaf100]